MYVAIKVRARRQRALAIAGDAYGVGGGLVHVVVQKAVVGAHDDVVVGGFEAYA